jgi:hypothetical protein
MNVIITVYTVFIQALFSNKVSSSGNRAAARQWQGCFAAVAKVTEVATRPLCGSDKAAARQ